MSANATPPRLEDVAMFAIRILKSSGIVDQDAPEPDWEAFARAQRRIESFEVPWTTITSLMRRFFFALAASARPEHLVGAGTFVGFAFAWLVMGKAQDQAASPLLDAVGLDIDADATALALRNAAVLELGTKLRFEQADAVAWLRASQRPISLLYIDIDEPGSRKNAYVDVLAAARPHLTPGALIVAHDAGVSLFANEFARFHEVIASDRGLIGPEVLPIDECGVSVSRVT